MLDSVILQKERLRLSAVRKDTQTHTHTRIHDMLLSVEVSSLPSSWTA
jgi:hypothetical protein